MKRAHRDLPVWQAAIELVPDVYRLTAKFPGDGGIVGEQIIRIRSQLSRRLAR